VLLSIQNQNFNVKKIHFTAPFFVDRNVISAPNYSARRERSAEGKRKQVMQF